MSTNVEYEINQEYSNKPNARALDIKKNPLLHSILTSVETLKLMNTQGKLPPEAITLSKGLLFMKTDKASTGRAWRWRWARDGGATGGYRARLLARGVGRAGRRCERGDGQGVVPCIGASVTCPWGEEGLGDGHLGGEGKRGPGTSTTNLRQCGESRMQNASASAGSIAAAN